MESSTKRLQWMSTAAFVIFLPVGMFERKLEKNGNDGNEWVGNKEGVVNKVMFRTMDNH